MVNQDDEGANIHALYLCDFRENSTTNTLNIPVVTVPTKPE
jgi:hypothetical protein